MINMPCKGSSSRVVGQRAPPLSFVSHFLQRQWTGLPVRYSRSGMRTWCCASPGSIVQLWPSVKLLCMLCCHPLLPFFPYAPKSLHELMRGAVIQ